MMANDNDLPAISLPTESTHIDINPVVKQTPKPVPPPAKRPPTEQARAVRPATAPATPATKTAAAATAAPRRPVSEAVRAQKPAARPATETVKAQRPAPAHAARPTTEAVRVQKPAATPPPPAQASKPAPPAQAPKPSTPAPVSAPVVADELAHDEDDPETLLRKYSERQKTKLSRLEQQLADYKKVLAERDEFRTKAAGLAKELESANKQLEVASKADEVIKDLQSRVDAAILSNTMLTDENGKLKKAVQDLQTSGKKFEDKAATADRASVEAQKALAVQTEARKQAESRIASALQALKAEAAPRKPAAQAPAPAPVPVRKK